MDDEPPEVQQYKTCAKCRIIERTKKKSRKPLAEETMRYGMRQFQEQSQNLNFIHDDIFTNDQLMSDMQAAAAAAAAHDALLMGMNPQKQPQNQQHQHLLNSQQYSPQQYAALYKQPLAQQYAGAPGISGVAGNPGAGSAVGLPADATSYSYLYGTPGVSAGASGSVYPPVSGGTAGAQRPALAVSAGLPLLQAQQQLTRALGGGGSGSGVGSGSGAGSIAHTSVGSPAGQYAVPTSSATAAAIAAAAIKRTDPLLGTSQALSREQSHYRQYQQKQQGGDRTRLAAATHCELCGHGLDVDDAMSAMYRLCRSCYSDPYALPNVYSDFNDFLLAVVRDKDAVAVTYISELASYLVESLSNNRAITSEEQFRKIMMDSFLLIYVDPLVGLLAPLSFTRSSNNVHEINNTSPIVSKVSQQFHYTLTPPLRINYAADADLGTTTIDMTFITETNLIIMKKTTTKAACTYDSPFLRSLDEQMRAKGFTFDEDPAKVYEFLDLSILKDQFVKDFKSLHKQISEIRASATASAAGAEAETEAHAEGEANALVEADADVPAEAAPEAEATSDHNGTDPQEHKTEPSLDQQQQQQLQQQQEPQVNGTSEVAEPVSESQQHEANVVETMTSEPVEAAEQSESTEQVKAAEPTEQVEPKAESTTVKEAEAPSDLDPAFAS